ncbi:uncharacterized protein LOC120587041 [Pteropus medius]|uniref:uncharacterized protein LOC120587041 n=1 Tax=Pteropus vampyrus TaxID=132908 RepID=UPI00196B2B7C|nr:uncharacterized protein LOC120587041 [Pteropus giganteus]
MPWAGADTMCRRRPGRTPTRNRIRSRSRSPSSPDLPVDFRIPTSWTGLQVEREAAEAAAEEAAEAETRGTTARTRVRGAGPRPAGRAVQRGRARPAVSPRAGEGQRETLCWEPMMARDPGRTAGRAAVLPGTFGVQEGDTPVGRAVGLPPGVMCRIRGCVWALEGLRVGPLHGHPGTQPRLHDAPGVVPGIIGAVVVAVAGAISSFIAYQKKKFCFKENAFTLRGSRGCDVVCGTRGQGPVDWAPILHGGASWRL